MITDGSDRRCRKRFRDDPTLEKGRNPAALRHARSGVRTQKPADTHEQPTLVGARRRLTLEKPQDRLAVRRYGNRSSTRQQSEIAWQGEMLTRISAAAVHKHAAALDIEVESRGVPADLPVHTYFTSSPSHTSSCSHGHPPLPSLVAATVHAGSAPASSLGGQHRATFGHDDDGGHLAVRAPVERQVPVRTRTASVGFNTGEGVEPAATRRFLSCGSRLSSTGQLPISRQRSNPVQASPPGFDDRFRQGRTERTGRGRGQLCRGSPQPRATRCLFRASPPDCRGVQIG